MDSEGITIAVVFSVIVLFAVAGAVWISLGLPTVTEREAVKHGCAEFVMDPATGNSTFEWKDADAN